jgi:hypothetical protein
MIPSKMLEMKVLRSCSVMFALSLQSVSARATIRGEQAARLLQYHYIIGNDPRRR